tara:strand:+ start:527 stop:880 length:354 start_codon:yes stop_codon:yes gene_type:complete
MNDEILKKISNLIEEKKIKEAHLEISKLGSEYHKNSEYLYLRSRIFYFNKLYYLAIDTLLTALEFEKKDKIYILISEIYKRIGNEVLSKNILDLNLRNITINSLKNELSGIFRKDKN